MKIQNNHDVLSINLRPNELWFLSRLFAPGWVFGMEGPSENHSENELAEMEQNAYQTLFDEGLITKKGNQIQIDEFLGGMVYSCIHAKDLLIVNDMLNSKEIYFHFLPQWQLEICNIDGNYELTLFKQREDLFKHIVFIYELVLDAKSMGKKFSIPQRELELAAFLFESGKEEKAVEVFNQGYGDLPEAGQFLEDYHNPDFYIRFDLLRNRDDEIKMHAVKNELLQTNQTLYWVSYDEAGEEAIEMMNFTAVDPEQAERRFNLMLPVD
jgi:hypothetical protein